MSYPDDVSLNGNAYQGGADETNVYSLVSFADYSSLRSVAAPAESRTLFLSHDVNNEKGGSVVNGHLARLQRNYTDSNGVAHALRASLVLKVPQSVAVPDTDVYDIVGQLIDFNQQLGNMQKFLNREP